MIRRDITRGVLAGTLIISFNVALLALFRVTIPEGNRETVVYMLGQLSGMVTTALAFYFATTKSSADKNELALGALDAGREAMRGGPTPADREGDEP